MYYLHVNTHIPSSCFNIKTIIWVIYWLINWRDFDQMTSWTCLIFSFWDILPRSNRKETLKIIFSCDYITKFGIKLHNQSNNKTKPLTTTKHASQVFFSYLTTFIEVVCFYHDSSFNLLKQNNNNNNENNNRTYITCYPRNCLVYFICHFSFLFTSLFTASQTENQYLIMTSCRLLKHVSHESKKKKKINTLSTDKVLSV